jgi:hypothetical protein
MPISDLGLAATIAKCNPKKNKDMPLWLNDYMLSKLQSAKLANGIDLKSSVNRIRIHTYLKLSHFVINFILLLPQSNLFAPWL